MQLTPRYDGPPLVDVDASVGNPITPTVRQRRRMVELLGALDDDQWRAPSRCDGWTVQDVVSHLIGTNQFWAMSIGAGLAGTPTRFLATFDPVATPAQMVEPLRAQQPTAVLAQFADSVEALASAVEGIGPDELTGTVVESPPGHVSLTSLLLHALWDAWIHERDILLPLGRTQERHDDELTCCLAYAAALGPTFQAMTGSTREGTLVVDATDPDLVVVVDTGATARVRIGGDPPSSPTARLTGPAADLIEALSFRGPFPDPLPDDQAWLVAGLDQVFDRV